MGHSTHRFIEALPSPPVSVSPSAAKLQRTSLHFQFRFGETLALSFSIPRLIKSDRLISSLSYKLVFGVSLALPSLSAGRMKLDLSASLPTHFFSSRSISPYPMNFSSYGRAMCHKVSDIVSVFTDWRLSLKSERGSGSERHCRWAACCWR